MTSKTAKGLIMALNMQKNGALVGITTTCANRLKANGVARDDPMIIWVTNTIALGEWGPRNAPDRPAQIIGKLVFSVWGF